MGKIIDIRLFFFFKGGGCVVMFFSLICVTTGVPWPHLDGGFGYQQLTKDFGIFQVHTGMTNIWCDFVDIFRKLFAYRTKAVQKKWIRLWARPIHAVFKSPLLFIDSPFLAWMVAGMPKSIFWKMCASISPFWHASQHSG
jgi:hypothetical protein